MSAAMIAEFRFHTLDTLRWEARYLGIAGYRLMDETTLRAAVAVAQIEAAHVEALEVEAARPITRTEAFRMVAARSATTRNVCTSGVVRDGHLVECGAPAVTTYDVDFGGIVLEQGACTQHA